MSKSVAHSERALPRKSTRGATASCSFLCRGKAGIVRREPAPDAGRQPVSRRQVWRPGSRSGTVACTMRRVRPIIGVISDRRTLGHHAFQVQGEKYLTAIVAGAGGYPVGLPVLGPSPRRRLRPPGGPGVARRPPADRFAVQRGAPPLPGHCEPSGHPARSGTRPFRLRADSRGGQAGHSAVRRLPRLPGAQRRLWRHACTRRSTTSLAS